MVADGYGDTQPRSDAPRGIVTPTVTVTAKRMTAAEVLAEETADRLLLINALNQNRPQAEIRAMTPSESYFTFDPVGVRVQGLANITNNIVGGITGLVKENWAINKDAFAYLTGGQRSVVTGKFEPESGILRSYQSGTLMQDSAKVFGEIVTGTVKGPFDLIDGLRYGNADKIGSGGASVLTTLVPAAGLARAGRLEAVANTTEVIGGSRGTVTGAQWNELFSAKYGAENVFWDWPKNQGFVYGADGTGSLQPGQLIGRLGNERGTFASPLGTTPETLSLRPGTDLSNLNVYRVIQEVPGTRIGPAAPAFDMPGYGTQYELPKSIKELLNPANPYLERVTK